MLEAATVASWSASASLPIVSWAGERRDDVALECSPQGEAGIQARAEWLRAQLERDPQAAYRYGSTGRTTQVSVYAAPVVDYENDLRARASRRHDLRLAILNRCRDLERDAREERAPFSTASNRDLRVFLQRFDVKSKPSLFLLDTGNLRAEWRSDDGSFVGLQFLGVGRVQYVTFAKRPEPLRVSRAAGRELLAKVPDVLRGAGLYDMVFV